MTSPTFTRIWDLPLRLFHFFFAFSLAGALLIGFLVDDDSSLFASHKLFGLSAAILLVARLLMGWIGGRHARWSGLLFSPETFLSHLRNFPRKQNPGWAGHNPAAAWVYLLMFGLVTGLVASGLSMGGTEAFEEVHEVLALGLAATILMHFAGQVLHTWKFGEWISLSMVHGRKRTDPSAAVGTARAAGILMAFTILLLLRMWFSYERLEQTVHLPGTGLTVHLGGEGQGEHGEDGEEHHGDKDDD